MNPLPLMNPFPPVPDPPPQPQPAATGRNEPWRAFLAVLAWHAAPGVILLVGTLTPPADAGSCGSVGCPADEVDWLAIMLMPVLTASFVIASLIGTIAAGKPGRDGARVGSLAAVCSMIATMTAGSALRFGLW